MTEELHDALDLVLRRAVILATGNDNAEPRPGQAKMAHDVLDAFLTKGQAAAAAPTGTGKSLAYGVPAALVASLRKERTVIATESINLQSQLVDKDLPVVMDAIEQVTGIRPTFALMKGWSNYLCAAALYQVGTELIGLAGTHSDDPLADLDAVKLSLGPRRGAPDVDAVIAGIDAHLRDETGDRATFTVAVSDEEWSSMSTSTDECPGAEHCPFGAVCRPTQARAQLPDAAVIVTNHALLAIQAANDTKVVSGNGVVGDVKNLVVDEAHGLANTVRSQGSTNVNAYRLFDVLRAVELSHAGRGGAMKDLRTTGLQIMMDLDRGLAKRLGPQSIYKIEPDSVALEEGLREDILRWLTTARHCVPKREAVVTISQNRARWRALSRIDKMRDALEDQAQDSKNFARWIDRGRDSNRVISGLESATGATLRLAPVDVAPALRRNLYRAAEIGSEIEEDLGVVVTSATLPQASVVELGIMARRKEYESPFEVAFASSALFVPKATEADLAEICLSEGGKRRFDTSAHVGWASRLINELVAANGGSALVLAATTSAGKTYAEALRTAHPELVVHSQWDAGSTSGTVAEWRRDINSVLVGTRSLMTGVDAPGHTNSLVIIDRVPRSAGNPVDDARLAAIQARLEVDRWAADRYVYVADANLLIEQAAGRLIRSMGDSGMVAILDSRLLKTSPVKYPEPTRQVYMSALEKFGKKISDRQEALTWIAEHSARTKPVELVEVV